MAREVWALKGNLLLLFSKTGVTPPSEHLFILHRWRPFLWNWQQRTQRHWLFKVWRIRDGWVFSPKQDIYTTHTKAWGTSWKGDWKNAQAKRREKACEMLSSGHDSHYNMNSQQQLPALDLTRVNHGQRRVSQGPIPSWTTGYGWILADRTRVLWINCLVY